jgi:hypothetical protein
LIAAILLAAELHMGFPGVPAWVPYAVFIPIAAAWLIWLGRIKVEIADDELWAGQAHLPLRYIEDAEVITHAEKQRALGRELDPAPFVLHRPWVRTAVRLWLDDPDDPTPYWVVSTRHPAKLVELVKQS